LLRYNLKLSKLDKLKVVETYDGYPLDEKASFNVYIGRNIPKINPGDPQEIISKEDLDLFFTDQLVFEGLTRIECNGIWKGVVEKSELIIIFDATLRQVLTLFLEYLVDFRQEAVYIDILNSKQILLEAL
jgi:hypothetical protein